jgi:hypothetical protein
LGVVVDRDAVVDVEDLRNRQRFERSRAFELGREVLGEAAQHRADHALFLLAEEATVLVRDVAQPLPITSTSSVSPRASASSRGLRARDGADDATVARVTSRTVRRPAR